MPAPTPLSWQAAFVVTTYALGDSMLDAQAGLLSADWAVASGTARGLAHTERPVRAKALAVGLGHVAADLEHTRLA